MQKKNENNYKLFNLKSGKKNFKLLPHYNSAIVIIIVSI